MSRRELDIIDVAPGGEGLARDRGRPVFVPFTAPGDRVVAEVPDGAGPGHGVLLEVLADGPARVVPPCPHFGAGPGAEGDAPADDRRCGGCEWLHLAYDAQLAAKERSLAETLRRIGRLAPGTFELRPVLPSPSPLGYRSRAKLHLDRRTGRLVFFRRRSHDAVQLRTCHLLLPELERLRAAMGPALQAARLEPREVALEWSRHDGRGAALLRVAALGPARPRAERLLGLVPALSGLVLEAEGATPLCVGEPVLRQERRPGSPGAGLQRSRPDVFSQANREANALLVDAALDLLRPCGEDVLELYCGAGNFTGPLSRGARTVHAVEVQGPALDLARRDLEGARVRFFAGDALALARAFGEERGGREGAPSAIPRFGCALLDPPREGSRGAGAALRALAVGRVAYVSCDPATLARDVKGFVQAGYAVEAVQPVDMFPQTHHVEAIALLRLR